MTILEIIILSISLAMDCFTVSIACGTIIKNYKWRNIFSIALSFGIFQALMPLLGWFLSNGFQKYIESFDHWIAFGLLAFIGIRMVIESFKKDDDDKSIDPMNYKVTLTLSVATSVDALAVGISFALINMNSIKSILFPITMIGFVSFLMSIIGYIIGVTFGRKYNFRMELWGGLLLIIIGIKILFEHINIIS